MPDTVTYPIVKRFVGKTRGKIDETKDEFTEVYTAEFKDASWTVLDLYTLKTLPKRYDKHPKTDQFFVINVSHSQDENTPQLVRIEVTYCNVVSNKGQLALSKEFQFPDNPTERIPIVHFGNYVVQINEDMAYDGFKLNATKNVPIQTTALEPLLHKREKKYRTITIRHAVFDLPAIVTEEYEYVNFDPVKIPISAYSKKKYVTYPPGTLLIHDCTATDERQDRGYRYFEVTTVLHHNPDTWAFKPRNVGRQAFTSISVDHPNGRDKINKRSKTPTLIKVGVPPVAPLNPLPLRNTPNAPETDGLLFQDYYNYDPKTGKFKTNQDPITPARLAEIYKEATLKFWTVPAIRFVGYIPGLTFFN